MNDLKIENGENSWQKKKNEIMKNRLPSKSKKQDNNKSQENKSFIEKDFEKKITNHLMII